MESNNSNNCILLIGGGGHCHSVLETVRSSNLYGRIGVVAKDSANYGELQEYPIVSGYLVGVDANLSDLFTEGWGEAFITLGSIGNPMGRKKLYYLLKKIGFQIPTIIDKTAAVSSKAKIGQGVFIGKNAVVNIGCKIGDCTIINSGAIVEHDCRIGEFAHISPGTVVCGQVNIGNDSHIGAGSVVRQGINIGENALIGVGSVVVKDIPGNVKAYGNPCRVVE